jgi:hypothetical protein
MPSELNAVLWLTLLAVGTPAALAIAALALARHRDGPTARWLQRHSRGLLLAVGTGYLLLSALRFLGFFPGSAFAALVSLCAGVAFLGCVLLDYGRRTAGANPLTPDRR